MSEPTHDNDNAPNEASAAPSMERRNVVFVIGLLLACGMLFIVIITTMEGATYSVTVDEAIRNASELKGKTIKLQGNVVPGTVICPTNDECRFDITKNGENMTIIYAGTRPDTFKECNEVIVTGKMVNAEVFKGHDMIAKCPSKYDALPGGCERPDVEEEEAAAANGDSR